MEIAMVSGISPYTPKPGGTRSYILNLGEKLSSKGIKITIYGVTYNLDYAPHHKGFEFIPVVKGRKISSIRYLFCLFLKTPFLGLSKDALIHAHRPDVLFPFVFFKTRNSKICTMHGIPNIGMSKKRSKATWKIYTFLEKFSLKRVDRVVFVDTKTEEWYLKKYSWLSEKSCVIPVGVDLELFKPMDKNALKVKFGFNAADRIILYVGRLEIEKRVDMLIESFNMIEQSNVKLIIIGNGPEKDRLMELARNPNIKFLGTFSHERIPEILNCADVLALCSEYEGMPTIVLEALACGIPVVSTNVGDLDKVVLYRKTGYLAKAEIEDFKEKILMTLKDGEAFKQNCLDVAKQYSFDVITDKILNVYKEVHNRVK